MVPTTTKTRAKQNCMGHAVHATPRSSFSKLKLAHNIRRDRAGYPVQYSMLETEKAEINPETRSKIMYTMFTNCVPEYNVECKRSCIVSVM